MNIAIIIGSTRPQRKGEAVARYVFDIARQRDDAEFELVDLCDVNLPLLDEPKPAGSGVYTQPHTKAWAARMRPFDAYIFVTPEYNHNVNGALKNALDFLYAEWNNKAAGIVSYGAVGGARAAEQLRLVLSNLKIAHVRSQVMFSTFTDFEGKEFKPHRRHKQEVETMLDEVIAWGSALKGLREGDDEGA